MKSGEIFLQYLNQINIVNEALGWIVQFQKISILPPQKGLEFPGGGGGFGGFCQAKKFKEMYEA